MNPIIKMVDLQAQQRLIRKKLDVAICKVLDSCQYILGEQVIELEQKLANFCGAKFAISCANGTDALTLVLKAKQVTNLDAIFVPAFTFTATAEAVVLAGANPVFVDVLEDSFNIDPNSLEEAIILAKKKKLRPTGIIPVDLFGLPASYSDLQSIATKHELWILCDAAQSFGAKYFEKKIGTFGCATATSFFPSKPLGCYGDGGCIFTDHFDLAEIIRSIRFHGANITNGSLDQYNNIRIGTNSRLDSLQATILLEKLKIFPKELILRNKIAKMYNKLLKNLEHQVLILPKINKNFFSSWAQYTITLKEGTIDNKQLQSALKESGIPSAIYYPKPLSSHAPYMKFYKTDLSVAKKLSNYVLSLPMHPYLSMENINYIVNKLQELLLCVV